jgi:NAD(P)-dependent dehydrogenase (short-subunit alcohol dehydrogenase family)
MYYAQALAPEGFKLNALAPGLRATNLNARAAASGGDPAEAAAGAVRVALLPTTGSPASSTHGTAPRSHGERRWQLAAPLGEFCLSW